MTAIIVYALLLIVLTPPLGGYMYRVYTRERIGRAEGLVYRMIGVNPERSSRGADTPARSCGSAGSA